MEGLSKRANEGLYPISALSEVVILAPLPPPSLFTNDTSSSLQAIYTLLNHHLYFCLGCFFTTFFLIVTLVTDLFELAMLESPDSKAQIEQFSLAELAHDVLQKFELKTSQKKLQVRCDVPEDAPFVQGDIAMIERVLENLIENAIKFSDEGGTLSITVSPCESNLEVKVVDTGIGIAENDLPNLFQRFYRVDKSRSDRAKGSGLGLAIAYRILQLHGSDISVTSMPGEGSCFFFRLPIAAV